MKQQEEQERNKQIDVEFKIVDELIDFGRHGSTIVKKAKLIEPKETETWESIMKYCDDMGWNDRQTIVYLICNYEVPKKK